MKLPVQPQQYNRTLEQQRSGELEREIQKLLAEIQRLKLTTEDHEARIAALEP